MSDNLIYGVKNSGHCTISGTGVQTAGQPRLENNRIRGFDAAYTCSAGIQAAIGLDADGAPDVHSNYIAAVDAGCFGPRATTSLGVYNGGTGGKYRNNILVGGDCGQAFKEAGATDPALFEHNALNPMTYVDEGTTTLTSASAVDALTDMTASGTLAGACAATADRHLVASSMCIDAGTTDGAPEFDMDGQVRDSKPDIGPDEYVP